MNFDISDIRSAYQSGATKPADVDRQVEAMFMEILVESMENSIEAEGAASSVAIYIEVFQNVGILAVGVGVAILIISPILRKYMHGVH